MPCPIEVVSAPTKKAIKKTVPAKGAETALAVRVDKCNYFTAPCATIAEAQVFTIQSREAILADGGDNISGAIVYHPTKGAVAYISPNGRAWKISKEEDAYRGRLQEFTGVEADTHFTKLFI